MGLIKQYKRSNLYVIRAPKRNEKEHRAQKFEEMMGGNFLDFTKDIKVQSLEAQQSPNLIMLKNSIPSCIIIKMLNNKTKKKAWKQPKKNNITPLG